MEIIEIFDDDINNTNNQVNNNDNKRPIYERFSAIKMYGEDLTSKTYITNPAIARENEIKRLMIILLTPEKSALLVGKAGIGKTAIVEGLAYLIQRNKVPEALKGYRIIKVNSTSLIGNVEIDGREEMIINIFVEELKQMSKVIVFIDEVHTLIGAKGDGPMDLANILKPALDRGDIKAIGATTTIEYNTYVVRDRAFLRRFEKIDVLEPDQETTVKILMGTLPKIEKQTGIKFKYNEYVTKQLIESIVSATSEFKRVYGLSAMYPDVAFSVLSQAFSHALYHNKKEVDIVDVYNAIKSSKRIYPDSIVKELGIFREKFAKFLKEEGIVLPIVTINDIEKSETII
ncbi:MAG: ATP-dependent Clp protease ATP-binding subunit [Mollicutes bacterium]|nr:ATP-dependent Clp protease ATP-binding subunit [Mollicutes bacterium]